jgi:16S rRNA (guanine527-N7)-methyltransferase
MIGSVEDFLSDLNVPRETFLRLESYVALLLKWNKAINLISANETDLIWQKHIIICAELMQYIENKNVKIVDLGSGGGLPSVVLSIMGINHVVAVESNSKKAAFLLQAAQLSNHKFEVINQRIEKVQLDCDIITSRALASVTQLLEFTQYVNFTHSMLLIKGADVKSEINVSKQFNFAIVDSKYSSQSSIVIVRKTNA